MCRLLCQKCAEGGTVKKRHVLVVLAVVAVLILLLLPASASAGAQNKTSGEVVYYHSPANSGEPYPYSTYAHRNTASWLAKDRADKGHITFTAWLDKPGNGSWSVWESHTFAVTDVFWNAGGKYWQFYAPDPAHILDGLLDEGVTGWFRVYNSDWPKVQGDLFYELPGAPGGDWVSIIIN